MCILAAGAGAMAAEIGTTVAATAASVVAQSQAASRNASLIQGQVKLQQNQIAVQAGHEESAAAQEARAAQAQSIAAAGAAGINTGSNSFLASLQTTAMNASQQEQAISESEQNSEEGSIAEADTQLATAASQPTFLGAGLEIGVSGASAYTSANLMESIYEHSSSGGPPVSSVAPGDADPPYGIQSSLAGDA
jgi:hypothetical protein